MPEHDLGRLADHARQAWAGRKALSVDGGKYTFADLHILVVGYAAMMRGAGVRADDHVLLQLPNGVELVALVHAAWRLGAIPVPLVGLYRERELAGVIADSRPRVIVGVARSKRRYPTTELDVAIVRSGHTPAARFCVGSPPTGWQALDTAAGDVDPARGGECALVLYTSGTTSEPKGVRHPARSLLATVGTYERNARMTGDDVVLVPAPMAHVGAFVCGALIPVCLGVPAVLLPKWDATEAAEVIAAEGVTFGAGATVMLSDLVGAYETGASPEHRLTKFQTGAASVPSELIRRADALGITAWRAWGMTECPSAATSGVADDFTIRATTDGRIEPGVEVRTVDSAGRPQPPGVGGELCVRGAKLMLGYSSAERTAEQVDGEGWFHTGDLGVVRDGRVTVTGRVKDIINRGGEKFSARDIEEVICMHPAVASAAVVGVPDPRLGEVVVAYVTTRPGTTLPNEERLTEHLAARGLARQKFPVAWRVLDSLPRTATGKVRKRDLISAWVARDSSEVGQSGRNEKE